jgi:hypothetical protein
MAEPIKPVSRLEDASLGNSNAIAEQRRATNAERQSMAVERSMQRQYRRAVRRNDMQAISVLGSQMSDMGLSRTGGGGIQDSQENNRIASDRAFNRADQLNQAGGRGGSAPRPLRENPMANPQNGAEGPLLPSQEVDGANAIEAAAGAPGAVGARGTNGQTGNGTISPNSRPAGTAGVRESRLLPENNPAPSSNAASSAKKRLTGGTELFEPDVDLLSRPVTPVSSEASESVKLNEAPKTQLPASDFPVEETAYDQAVRYREAIRGAKKLTDEGLFDTSVSEIRTQGLKDKLDSGFYDPISEPPIARTPSAKVKNPAAFKKPEVGSTAYWSVDPNQIVSMKKTVGEGTGAYLGADTSDPRFPVMKIIQDAQIMMKDAYSSRNAKRKVYNALAQVGFVAKDEFYSDENAKKQLQEMVDHEVIWRAAREGVDLTDYARTRGPQFFNDYQEAKNVQTEIKKSDFYTQDTKAKVANLISR